MIAIKTSPGCCVGKPKVSGGLMLLTASGLRPSAVRCIIPPRPWVFTNTAAWLDLNPYTNVSALPCYSHSIFTVWSKFIMNYKLTFFKA